MSQSILPFNKSNFQRAGGGVTFEQEAVQPSDFTTTEFGSSGGKTYAQIYAEDEEGFNDEFPAWEKFADYFIKKRAVQRVSGKQACTTNSFTAGIMNDYTSTEKVSVVNMRIPGGLGGEVPSGKWLNDGMDYSDRGNGYTDVTVKFVQYLEWQLLKIQDGTPPNPKGA